MRILILNLRDYKHPRAGGAEHFTHEVARRWAESHIVSLVSSRFEGCAATEIVDGIDITRLGNYWTVRSKARQCYRERFKGKCDVIVDEYTLTPFLAPAYAQEPVVFLVHEVIGTKHLAVLPPGLGHFMHYVMEPRWYRPYRDVETVTVSESTKADLKKLGLKRIHLVREGTGREPVAQVPEKEEVPTLLYVGLLKKANLVDHAIKAFKLIEAEIPAAKLWVVGRGPERKSLKALARGSNVQFFGFVDDDYKFDLMQRAHAILVPGIREGWGLVITEANSCGTPAIGYDIVGHRDSIRDGETGLLTEPTPEAMAQAALRLLADDRLQSRLANNALRWSSQFSWDATAAEFMAVLENVLNT